MTGVPLNIDWQQILLHLFNFTILFGALYILLYKPVKDFMTHREEHFAEMESKAGQALADAEKNKEENEKKLSDFEEKATVENALAQGDLLSREKELDQVVWEKIGSLETFHYFDLTAVLAYIAKLHIVNRWLALDEEKGRELFKQLVNEVRSTFKGVEYTE